MTKTKLTRLRKRWNRMRRINRGWTALSWSDALDIAIDNYELKLLLRTYCGSAS